MNANDGLASAARRGCFELQQCARCGAVQYPAREACRRCLSDDLAWRTQSPDGELIAETLVHRSNDDWYNERAPWRIGLVRLPAGVTLVAHVHAACAASPALVRVEARIDHAGRPVIVAFPRQRDRDAAADCVDWAFDC
jgi:uncharacterized OB-fold protein